MIVVLADCANDSPDGSARRQQRSADSSVWNLEGPLTVIGTEGREDFEFQNVGAGRLLKNGDIIVVDAGAKRILRYSRAGKLIWRYGHDGAGPGEFLMVESAVIDPAGTTYISDRRLSRITEISERGRLEAVHSIQPGSTAWWLTGILSGRRVLITQNDFESGKEHKLGTVIRDSVDLGIVTLPRQPTLIRFDERTVKPLLRVPDKYVYARTIMTTSGHAMKIPYPLRFSPRAMVQVWHDQIYVASGDNMAVSVHDAAGANVARYEAPVDSVPVTKADIERVYRRYIDEVRDEKGNRIGQGDPGGAIRRLFDETPTPKFKPAMGYFLVDAEGNAWVGPYEAVPNEATDARWSVFRRDGTDPALVEMPRAFRALHIGNDQVLGIRTDELDVQRLELYRINKHR